MKYVFLFIITVFTLQQASTQNRRIVIEYAGFSNTDEVNFPSAKILTRDDAQQIHIIHEGVNMWCDKAIFYGNDDFIEAYGNVKMKQGDTINMTSKYVEYSGKTKLAFASGDVVLKDPTSTITTDTMYYDRARQQSYYRSGGKVVRDSSGTITSTIGRYYMQTKKYRFVNKVKLVNPDYTIDTNQLDFYSETGYAFLYGPSTITTEESKTYCERGFYDTENKRGYAVKKSRIDYDNRIFEGDSMFFDNNRGFASATNNIKVTDTANSSIVKGHYAEVFKDQDSVFITKRALAITVQDNDSIYIHSDTLMVTGKPEHRITRAFRNVRLFKSDMSGKADSVHVDQKTGLTKLINLSRLSKTGAFTKARHPILWHHENQMTGDTIHLKSNTETEKLDSLIVFNNAFLISKDTLTDDGFNQIKGKRLIGLFNDENNLRQVDVIKNAESIFYARNDKQELIGIDKAKSASIKILFENNDIDQYFRYTQTEAKMYPEEDFPQNARKFRGFVWREEERPMSVDDLFKDDPPFTLPVIKGLEDKVEGEEFFNADLLDRIDKADKQEQAKQKSSVKTPSKASRHIPKAKAKPAKPKLPEDEIPKQNLPKPLIAKDDN